MSAPPTTTSSETVEHQARGELASAISTGTVRLVREYTGRGPTKTRTYLNRDYIAVVMADLLTKGERSLVKDGQSELVLDARKAYQHTMREDLIKLVEGLTERKVIAFLSDNHLEPDMAVESFILEPTGSDHHEDPRLVAGGPVSH